MRMAAIMDDRLDPSTASWHWDKRVPIALIVTVGIMVMTQTAGAMWWASAVSQRLAALETLNSTTADQAGRLIHVEVLVDTMNKALDRVEAKLDNVTASKKP